MTSFFSWFITSSADPEKISVMIRGILVGCVPVLITIAQTACLIATALCVDISQINPLIEGIVNIVKLGLELVAAGMFVFGLLRKIYLGRWVHPAAV